MRTKLSWVVGVAVAVVVYFVVPQQSSQAQTGAPQIPGSSPVGLQVNVTLVAWPLSTAEAGRVNGTLLSMTGEWLVVKDGSVEHWIPREKLLTMKASR